MSRNKLLITTVAVALAACVDLTGSRSSNVSATALSPVFMTVPAGFSENSSSFDPSGDAGQAFFPGEMRVMPPMSSERGPGDSMSTMGRRPDDDDHHDGFGGRGLRGILMGGGLGHDFLGFIPFGKAFGRGPFFGFRLPDACTFSTTTGRVTCPDKVRDGITISASFQFKDTAGASQPNFDTTSTDYANARIDVSGTKVRRDSSTSTLDHHSDRTVTGLAPGSTERTVNGTASASETTVGTRDSVHFTAVRIATDSTRGLVIPLRDGHPTFPTAGVVIRTMSVTITPDGGTAKTRSRREEITFNGTGVIRVIIDQDGVTRTRTCTISTVDHRLTCDDSD